MSVYIAALRKLSSRFRTALSLMTDWVIRATPSTLVRRYLRAGLSLEDVACELGLPDTTRLTQAIELDALPTALKPLLEPGNTIPRPFWKQSIENSIKF